MVKEIKWDGSFFYIFDTLKEFKRYAEIYGWDNIAEFFREMGCSFEYIKGHPVKISEESMRFEVLNKTASTVIHYMY